MLVKYLAASRLFIVVHYNNYMSRSRRAAHLFLLVKKYLKKKPSMQKLRE